MYINVGFNLLLVVAKGNIEDWLMGMLRTQCLTMKDLCRAMAIESVGISDPSQVR
jgi:hypothetical protein